jgi:hypothetical protein
MEKVRSRLNIVRSQSFPIIMALSLLVYLPEILSICLAVKAVGIALSFGNSLVLTGAARLATQLPGGPVFLGPCNLRML